MTSAAKPEKRDVTWAVTRWELDPSGFIHSESLDAFTLSQDGHLDDRGAEGDKYHGIIGMRTPGTVCSNEFLVFF